VVHHRQRLPFGLEAGDDLPAVHTRLDDFQGDFALDGLGLLGHPDDAHSAFADLLQELVGADHRARMFADWFIEGGAASRARSFAWAGSAQETARLGVGAEKFFDALAKALIAGASLVKVACALRRRRKFERGRENVEFVHDDGSGAPGANPVPIYNAKLLNETCHRRRFFFRLRRSPRSTC
jgi:hypothetical protein